MARLSGAAESARPTLPQIVPSVATRNSAWARSKTFVALALLKLQEEGKVNLYARLQDVAPEIPFKNRWEAAHPVRIVNLLEHTAGFDDMEPSEVYNEIGRASCRERV